MTPSGLQQLMDKPAREFPEKVAIRSPDGFSCTFSELRASISSVASALLRSAVQRGERVVWLLPNGLEALQLSCACYQVAAISVPINLRYSAPEVAYMVGKVQAKMLFLHSSKLQQLPGASQLAPEVVATPGPAWDAFRSRADPALPALRPAPAEQPALILFTSGSTGRPKGVLHSHGGCWAAIQTAAETFALRSDDVVLVGKPISHAGGLQTQLLPTLARGGEAVLAMMPTAAQAVELIQRFNVSVYAMLSSALLDFVEHLEHRDLGSVAALALRRVVGSGDAAAAEPVPGDVRVARSGGLWHHRDWWLLRRPAAGPARPRGQGGCHGKADEGDPGTAGGGRKGCARGLHRGGASEDALPASGLLGGS